MQLNRVLLVSDSPALREVLPLVLAEHAQQVITSGTRRGARTRFQEDAELQLVIAEMRLPDGNGLELLADVVANCETRPKVILLVDHPDDAEARRAVELGAVGYLATPISYSEIAGVLKRLNGHTVAPRAPRRRPGGRACLLDPGPLGTAPQRQTPQLVWHMRDVSTSGAFLETESPMPIGRRLDLTLEIGGRRVHVRSEVVRVQDPAWGREPGVGITFVDLAPDVRLQVEAYVDEGGDDVF